MPHATASPCNEEVARYYDAMTRTYLNYGGDALAFHTALLDEPTPGKEGGLLRSNEILVEGLNLKHGEHVVDLGCGVGGLALYLAERLRVNVTGVTLCSRHARLAKRLARSRGVASAVDFRVMDFMDLKFEPESFEAAFCQESFCYAEDGARFLRDVRRALKPGGRWRAVDVFRADVSTDPTMEGALRSIERGWKTPPFRRVETVLEDLAQAGFDEPFSRDLTPLVHPAARAFIREKLLRDMERQFGCFVPTAARPDEEFFHDHMEACAAYGLGILNGTLTYRLIGASKPVRNDG